MSKRSDFIQSEQEYRETVKEAEKRRLQGEIYQILAESGSEDGYMRYDASDDTLEINIAEIKGKIPGKYLVSINKSLSNLLE
jgi:hypothetical protein